eukprot:TRINITY_DN10504_c0_g1_i1.p2 TRINITY_DN10504_c0_g1~~TRINITY_DN10504_c0_g1_i1.p2  ORF type:complete len:121 (-),score=42.30 TRINITY_DN10504_c0_g1_i1:137-460(-)
MTQFHQDGDAFRHLDKLARERISLLLQSDPMILKYDPESNRVLFLSSSHLCWISLQPKPSVAHQDLSQEFKTSMLDAASDGYQDRYQEYLEEDAALLLAGISSEAKK